MKLNHIWTETGTYTIRAKLKDYCNESSWGTLEVTIPRDKVIVNWLSRFFVRFPFFEIILRLIIWGR